MKSKSAGFSLIELLVATSVMAIGLVGTIAMQATAKQNGVDSSQRSIAVALANDMLNRMQVNKTQLGTYRAANYGPGVFNVAQLCNYDPASAVNCTPNQLALSDQYQWDALLQGIEQDNNGDLLISSSGMINPVGCVDYQQTTGQVTVVISWLGRKAVNTLTDTNAASGATNREVISTTCGAAQFSGNLNRRRQVTMTAFIYQ
ncbi:type IV pilus modification protein PilV [Catenovulum sp. SM1970]|uniref:type IV pilus modification protein PilV n=1 Tax=Marinifaba aquimaris TaxID=2741323 RepID=UPI0015732BBB|nr:type IV pilus modification protein PilV [Marinifaba aquimaris]NTS76718.1 type IV pilus modification protein PilV [Marinifaba aquimaris]